MMDISRSKILLSITVLFTFSLITIWSTVPHLFFYQLSFLAIGLIFMYYFSKLDLRLILDLSTPLYLLSIFLLLLTLLFGESVRGSTRWLNLGFFSPQTSEFVKPLLVLFYAGFLGQKALTLKRTFVFALLSLVPFMLVLRQPDLGSSLVLLATSAVLYISSNFSFKKLSLSVLLLLLLIPLGLKLAKPYQLERVKSFLNPYSDTAGGGYNAIQSTIAVGSGKFFGKGVSLGTQSHLHFLPERHTDFIFASFVEEFGFLGGFLVLGSFFILLQTMLRVASKLNDPKLYLVQIAIFTIFVFQTFVNIGMNLGLAPVTGITLPLFSYGGSSLITSLILIGFQLKLLDLSKLQRI
jgi:rod shape determining protein RodA